MTEKRTKVLSSSLVSWPNNEFLNFPLLEKKLLFSTVFCVQYAFHSTEWVSFLWLCFEV